jgi:hypothetical protein
MLAATERTRDPAPAGLIPLTCNEIARLLNRLILDPARRLADTLTTTPPTPSQNQPLPDPARDLITIYGWSTKDLFYADAFHDMNARTQKQSVSVSIVGISSAMLGTVDLDDARAPLVCDQQVGLKRLIQDSRAGKRINPDGLVRRQAGPYILECLVEGQLTAVGEGEPVLGQRRWPSYPLEAWSEHLRHGAACPDCRLAWPDRAVHASSVARPLALETPRSTDY